MTVKPEPVNPMNRFNARYGSIKKKTTAEQPAPTEPKAEGNTPKDTSNKKHRTANDLSELSEILEEAEKRNQYSKSKSSRKNKRRKRLRKVGKIRFEG